MVVGVSSIDTSSFRGRVISILSAFILTAQKIVKVIEQWLCYVNSRVHVPHHPIVLNPHVSLDPSGLLDA